MSRLTPFIRDNFGGIEGHQSIRIDLVAETGELLGYVFRNETGPKYVMQCRKHAGYMFGASFSRFIKKSGHAFLVEGIFDCMSMHEAGFRETLGMMGLFLRREQILWLKTLCDEITLCMDNDPAGKAAGNSNALLLRRYGFKVNYIDFDGAKDVDELFAQGRLHEVILGKRPFPVNMEQIWNR